MCTRACVLDDSTKLLCSSKYLPHSEPTLGVCQLPPLFFPLPSSFPCSYSFVFLKHCLTMLPRLALNSQDQVTPTPRVYRHTLLCLFFMFVGLKIHPGQAGENLKAKLNLLVPGRLGWGPIEFKDSLGTQLILSFVVLGGHTQLRELLCSP